MSDCGGVQSVVLVLSLVHTGGNLLTWQAAQLWTVLAGRLVVGASVHTVWERYSRARLHVRPVNRSFPCMEATYPYAIKNQ